MERNEILLGHVVAAIIVAGVIGFLLGFFSPMNGAKFHPKIVFHSVPQIRTERIEFQRVLLASVVSAEKVGQTPSVQVDAKPTTAQRTVAAPKKRTKNRTKADKHGQKRTEKHRFVHVASSSPL